MPFACCRDLIPNLYTFSSAFKYIWQQILNVCESTEGVESLPPSITLPGLLWLSNSAHKFAGTKS